MKTVEQIKNEYAVDHGFSDWEDLVCNISIQKKSTILKITIIEQHLDRINQLIQDELKKKMANIEDIKIDHVDEFGDYIDVIGTEKETIINTENIK